MRNYYELLGVPSTASFKQIKQAYLVILKKYHPDVFEGDKTYAENVSASINVAYATLSSSVERLKYDRSIFPEQYSQNYFYDEQGFRVPIITQTNRAITEIEYDSLPIFSFFHKNKLSEFFVFRRSLTPKQMQERKNRKKQEKKQQKQQNKPSKQPKAQKQPKTTNVPAPKQAIGEYYKGKRKLDIIIILLSIVLFSLIGLIVVLNLQHALNL